MTDEQLHADGRADDEYTVRVSGPIHGHGWGLQQIQRIHTSCKIKNGNGLHPHNCESPDAKVDVAGGRQVRPNDRVRGRGAGGPAVDSGAIDGSGSQAMYGEIR